MRRPPIKLPKVGWVRMREAIRFDGMLKPSHC